MMRLARRIMVAVVVLAVWTAGSAAAQENLDKGKTPAQLYASDCAICHKSPRGLAKGVGRFGLGNFLREHYTASRESAAVISAYPSQSKTKASTDQRDEAKASNPKAGEPKRSEPKPTAAQPAEAKAEAPKVNPTKPAPDSEGPKPDKSN
jgi:mono/diheme cytochrome c family protein